MLKSRDLIDWEDCGSAINPPPFVEAPCYWAPEVFYDNGKFYLYYSVGNEEFMEIRVAVSNNPAGKYLDSGKKLTHEQFAIDAHVFVDEDNSRWMFYATDFLNHSHIGTGTVRDRMISPFELEGKPQPVSRAKYDWQVYDPNRASKGFVRWHTIEGSAVLKRKGVYYQMFSGGNWQNISYGVSYAITRNIKQTEEWQQIADGETTLPILRTIPDKVIGPGHNSVVRGTDNRQLYCVYHVWAADLSGRQMAIDRLDFVGEKMIVLGATYENEIAPNPPTVQDFFDSQNLGENWESKNSEEWKVETGAAISNPAFENIETSCRIVSNSFLVEVSARAVEYSRENCGYGFCLKQNEQTVLRCLILPASKQIEISAEMENRIFDLPKDFDSTAFHLWRVEVDNFLVKIQLDEANFKFEKLLKTAPQKFALATRQMSAAFAGFALTVGFEDLFDWQNADFNARAWQIEENKINSWKIANNLLQCNSVEGETEIFKNLSVAEFELVVNACLPQPQSANGCYGFVLRENSDSKILLTIEPDNEKRFLRVSNKDEAKRFALPADFASNEFQQFRLRLKNGILRFQSGTNILGEIEVETKERQIGLFVKEAEAVFDMLRLTAL